MTDPRFVRQETLGVRRDQTVAVIGVGGIGSWVALALGQAGVKKLLLFDEDTVDVTNLHRLPPGVSVGNGKAAAVVRLLPPGVALAYGHFHPTLHKDTLGRCRWAVVCTDNLRSRRSVYELCGELGVNYIECGAEGHRATVSFSPASWTEPEEELPGYQSVPVFIGPCLLAASIASYYVLLGNHSEGRAPETVAEWKDSMLSIYQHGGTHGTETPRPGQQGVEAGRELEREGVGVPARTRR